MNADRLEKTGGIRWIASQSFHGIILGICVSIADSNTRQRRQVYSFQPSAWSAPSGDASGLTSSQFGGWQQQQQQQNPQRPLFRLKSLRQSSDRYDRFVLNTDHLLGSFSSSASDQSPDRARIYRRDNREDAAATNKALGPAAAEVGDTGRLLSNQAFSRISETLGAINTVGHYLVGIVDDSKPEKTEEDLPDAIYTISKNVLGRNVTDTIAPFVRVVAQRPHPITTSTTTTTTTQRPHIYTQASVNNATPRPQSNVEQANSTNSRVDPGNGASACTTPEGKQGTCEDLSNCPQLLLNLGNLRQSLCFKKLFVPGVCCPIIGQGFNELPASAVTTQKPLLLTTRRPALAFPVTTKRPIVYQTTPTTTTRRTPVVIDPASNFTNYVNPEECGEPEWSAGRVVGGTEAASGAWPWLAAIFLSGPTRTEFWCGGALIGVRHVLTAAHCTRDTKQRPFLSRQFTVRLGDVDLQREDEPSRPATFRVAEVRAHPSFSRVGFYNDIAVLVLDGAVQKSKYVIPICLPQGGLRAERWSGRRATVVGWGTTRYGGRESTSQRQAVLPVWRNADCDRAYFQPISEGFICAGYSEGGVDACQGDSGGPLMIQATEGRWVQVGIVSFGNKCGEPGYPGVYTRVSEYLDWIKSNAV